MIVIDKDNRVIGSSNLIELLDDNVLKVNNLDGSCYYLRFDEYTIIDDIEVPDVNKMYNYIDNKFIDITPKWED